MTIFQALRIKRYSIIAHSTIKLLTTKQSSLPLFSFYYLVQSTQQFILASSFLLVHSERKLPSLRTTSAIIFLRYFHPPPPLPHVGTIESICLHGTASRARCTPRARVRTHKTVSAQESTCVRHSCAMHPLLVCDAPCGSSLIRKKAREPVLRGEAPPARARRQHPLPRRAHTLAQPPLLLKPRFILHPLWRPLRNKPTRGARKTRECVRIRSSIVFRACRLKSFARNAPRAW